MLRFVLVWLLCATVFITLNCTTPPVCRVHVKISSARGLQAYLIQVPYFTEKEVVLDSQQIINVGQEVIFTIAQPPVDRQYKIRISKSFKEFYFIPDSKDIYITANNLNGKMQVDGSQATLSLLNFKNDQQALADSSEILVDSLKNTSAKAVQEELMHRFDVLTYHINEKYKRYVDTVTNAAMFIAVYNSIILDQDYEWRIQVLEKARKKFAGSKIIAQLYDDTKNIIDIYTAEYEVGDKLPNITLPDLNDHLFSTSSLKDKYYLIDFWASWCDRCSIYNHFKKQLRASVDSNHLQIVSVALDDDIAAVKLITQAEHLNWIQLVDRQMWNGPAVRTLKFDSIPYNFLISPNGTILKKGIREDSLVSTIRFFMK